MHILCIAPCFNFIMSCSGFQAYNKIYADIATNSSSGSDCLMPEKVYENNMNKSCATCKPHAVQCPHGLFCFLLMDLFDHGSDWESLCR